MNSRGGQSTFHEISVRFGFNRGFFIRPYDTEQAIPTVEELVGVPDVHYSVDGEEAKSQLAELLKWLNSLIQPIVVEEECRGKFQAFLKFTNVDFVTVIPDPLDCELSNVLPTRAERLSSRLLPRSQLKRTYSRAGQWDEDDCSAQSQSLGQSKADSPSEVSRQRGLLPCLT